MTLAIIDIVLRSLKPEEVTPGVYEYTHELIKGVPATLTKNQNTNLNNANSVNVKTKLNASFSVIFANDSTNRYERIHYLRYGDVLYDVASVTPFFTRATIDIGDVSSRSIDDLIMKGDIDG